MLDLTAQQTAALATRRVASRVFIWIDSLDPAGAPSPAGFWSDVGNVALDDRTYYGSVLFDVATLSAKSDLTIPGLRLVFSGIAPEIAAQVRGNVVAQRPVEVSIGLFDPDSLALLPPLLRRFIGFVDNVEIATPKAGEKSTITLTCESVSRALTIRRTGTRAPATCRARWSTDKFYDYAAGQREQTIYFGRAAPAAAGGGTDQTGRGGLIG